MYLFEEYYKRHNIKSLQFFYNTFCVVLECNNINHIFSSKWINDYRHPGHFKISLKVVNHNGFDSEDIFNEIMDDNVEWNEYEYFMYDFFKNIKQKNNTINVVKKEEAKVTLWELFVCSTDNYFSKQSEEIKNYLSISLNKNLSYKDRIFNQTLILQRYYNTPMYKMWKNNFDVIIENYSPWVEKILEPSVIQVF